MPPSYFKLQKKQIWGWLKATGTHKEQTETIQYKLVRIQLFWRQNTRKITLSLCSYTDGKMGKLFGPFNYLRGLMKEHILLRQRLLESQNASCKTIDKFPQEINEEIPNPANKRIRDALICLEFYFGRLVIPYFFRNRRIESVRVVNR